MRVRNEKRVRRGDDLLKVPNINLMIGDNWQLDGTVNLEERLNSVVPTEAGVYKEKDPRYRQNGKDQRR